MKGVDPVAISKRITPRVQKSVKAPDSVFLSISGATYSGVPTKVFLLFRCCTFKSLFVALVKKGAPKFSQLYKALLSPKSI